MRIIRFSQKDDAKGSSIELSFKSLGDLVDQNDPSPYPSKEITEVAEDAIAVHVGDLPVGRDVKLSINLPEKDVSPEVQEKLPDTIRQHFTIRASEIALERKREKLRIKRGLKLLAATIAFTLLTGGVIRVIPKSDMLSIPIVQLFVTGVLTILNWAALWNIYETYVMGDYRELGMEIRIYEKIARMQIRITSGN